MATTTRVLEPVTVALLALPETTAATIYASDAPVMQMVQLSQLAERTFKRRFAQATGMELP